MASKLASVYPHFHHIRIGWQFMWLLGKTIALFFQFRERNYLFYRLRNSGNHPLAVLRFIGECAIWTIQLFQAIFGQNQGKNDQKAVKTW
jgi:hypothetical protein